jgi:hypothetical protein
MLILIVVAAAIALAAFVAGYESQYLAEQASAHNKALENLQVISLTPTVNVIPGADNYTNLSVVVGSLDVQNTTVKEITLNGLPLAFYTVTALGASSSDQICLLCGNMTKVDGVLTQPDFQLAPDEQATVSFNLLTWNPATQVTGGEFAPYSLPFDHFITIGMYTLLGNDFTRSFYPPTAIALTEQSQDYIDGKEVPTVVLDGSHTIAPTNGTIVSWSWSIYPAPGPVNGTPDVLSGVEQVLPQTSLQNDSYTISLTVTTSDGLIGVATVCYGSTVPCAPYDLATGGATAGSLTLSWSTPPGFDPGPPVTTCNVEFGTSPATLTEMEACTATETSFTVGGLAADTSYFFAVELNNTDGPSPYSEIAEGNTLA